MTEEFTAPKWLNKNLIELFLDKRWTVANYSVEPGSKTGDGFMAKLYRVKADLDNGESVSLIVKASLDSPEVLEVVELFKAFPKEIMTYRDIVPRFERIWFEYTKDEVRFGPKCWYSQDHPIKMIVLDDLTAQGYKLLDRATGLGLKECKIVLETIAKFHACSVKYHEENGQYDPLFDEGIARRAVQPMFDEYYDALFDEFIYSVEHNVKCGPEYLSKLRKWRGKQFDLNFHLTRANPVGFNVFNHGDLWVNNIMFKDVDGEPQPILIDFQLGHWTSPAIDLLYFIFNSCATDIIASEFDFFLEFYHKHLVESMIKLNCQTKTPTFAEITKDVHDKGFFGVMMINESIALMKNDLDEPVELEVLTKRTPESEALKRRIFASKKYVDLLEVLLPFSGKRGFLDVDSIDMAGN